ncbi:helix-turn-helix domain-containing protein [Bacillus licheniformis]|uniref:helix-turn-helix domain-containing protein n=1 Tax=Bacillus licheniformis TaxID=1402 RepID=UPI0037041705
MALLILRYTYWYKCYLHCQAWESENITTNVLLKICEVLDCHLKDILEAIEN